MTHICCQAGNDISRQLIKTSNFMELQSSTWSLAVATHIVNNAVLQMPKILLGFLFLRFELQGHRIWVEAASR